MRYHDLLDIPIYTFWELSRNVERIRAEEDQRMLTLVSHAFSGDPQKYLERLDQERGQVVVVDKTIAAPMDKSALAHLKSMMGGSADVD